jgi:hypothetical protein
MEHHSVCCARPSVTPPITDHSFVPTFTSSSSPSCSSANSLPYLSEAVEEVDEDDLFWSANTDSKQRSDSFSTSSSCPIRRYDGEGDFDVQSQGSPTKTGGIPIELTLFSDSEDDSFMNEMEGVITYQGAEVPTMGGLQRQKRSQRISRKSPLLLVRFSLPISRFRSEGDISSGIEKTDDISLVPHPSSRFQLLSGLCCKQLGPLL